MKTFTQKLTLTGLFLFTLIVMASCSIDAENNVTDADILSNELEDVIEDNDIRNVSVYLRYDYSGDTDYRIRHDQEYFELEDPFIRVAGLYYNLGKLDKYRINESNNFKYLELYFDIYY
jgi:hypothetical protein